MGSVSRWVAPFAPAGLVLKAIVALAAGILLLLGFILLRRAHHGRLFRRRDERTLAVRQQWRDIVSGVVSAESWRFDSIDRDIVESILLDRLGVAPPEEAQQLRDCLRRSGLLDTRIWESRHWRGWRRRQALVSLGRMRAAEAVPALAEALDDLDPETRLAALRGLGHTGLPEAAEQILERVVHAALGGPVTPLQNALLGCCRSCPGTLLRYVRNADDRMRPLLARVLAEVATPELDEELLLLASDPLSEVRASAARALGETKPRLALMALASLAQDEIWFVRLRAVVALGQLRDSRTIPVLIGTLCDPNRYVRLRSAAALARLEDYLLEIIEQVIRTRDRYALQALISELERSGGVLQLVNQLTDQSKQGSAGMALLGVVRAGMHRFLVHTLLHHPDWRIRVALARLLARSRAPELVPPLERAEAVTLSPRQRRIVRWVLRELRMSSAPRRDRIQA